MTEEQRSKIKELLDQDYFQLALEKQVRDRVDGYLKRLGVFALVLLAVAGFESWNVVDKAKKDYEKSAAELKIQLSELGKQQAQLRQETDKLRDEFYRAQEVEIAVQKAAANVEGEVQSVKNEVSSVKQIKKDATAATALAKKANEQAAQSVKDAEKAQQNAEQFSHTAKVESERAKVDAGQASSAARELKSLLPAQIELMRTKEATEVLVRGKKYPCVELQNWIKLEDKINPADKQEFGLRPQDDPEIFSVKFHVRHIHVHPVNLHMEVFKNDKAGCGSGEPIGAFVYQHLSKKIDDPPHFIPGTPFAFHMSFVYDPLLTYDFVVLQIAPLEKLLRDAPNSYQTPTLYRDPQRFTDTFNIAFTEPPEMLDSSDSEESGFFKQTFGLGSLGKAALLASYDQTRNSEPQWGNGAAGYSTRFASRYGRIVVDHSLRFGVGTLHGEDFRYHASDSKSILARTGHAIASTAYTRATDGSDTLALSQFAGAYGTAAIVSTWDPAYRGGVRQIAWRGTQALGIKAATNVLKEFAPDIQHLFDKHFVHAVRSPAF